MYIIHILVDNKSLDIDLETDIIPVVGEVVQLIQWGEGGHFVVHSIIRRLDIASSYSTIIGKEFDMNLLKISNKKELNKFKDY